jgi:hypothetical protein
VGGAVHDEPVPGLDSLDAAFDLPETVCDDPGLRDLYEVIVQRMRREAQYLPMNTVQQLLIERIASNYIMLRMKERAPVGSSDGFAHASVQKDFNTFWLSMTREFNSLLATANSGNREAILGEVRDLVLSTLGEVRDPTQRQHLMLSFSQAFEAAGL